MRWEQLKLILFSKPYNNVKRLRKSSPKFENAYPFFC